MRPIILVNEHNEEEEALVNQEDGRVIMAGDWYHDKINERIGGYIMALRDFAIIPEGSVIKEARIDRTHPLFGELEFYDPGEED